MSQWQSIAASTTIKKLSRQSPLKSSSKVPFTPSAQRPDGGLGKLVFRGQSVCSGMSFSGRSSLVLNAYRYSPPYGHLSEVQARPLSKTRFPTPANYVGQSTEKSGQHSTSSSLTNARSTWSKETSVTHTIWNTSHVLERIGSQLEYGSLGESLLATKSRVRCQRHLISPRSISTFRLSKDERGHSIGNLAPGGFGSHKRIFSSGLRSQARPYSTATVGGTLKFLDVFAHLV